MGWRLASFSETIWSPIRPKCQNSIRIQNEALTRKMKLLKRSWVNLEHFKHKEHINSLRSKKKKYFQTPGYCEISSEYNGSSDDHWDHHSMMSVMLYCDCAANCAGEYGYHLDFTHFYLPFWRRKWQATQVFLPGESHGQRSLVGYSPWGCKELDTTEWLTHTHTHTHIHTHTMGSVIGTSSIGSPTLEPLGIIFGPPMSHQNTNQRQIDHQVFLQQNGFIQNQQRIAVWDLQPWRAMCNPPHGKRRILL